MNKIAITLLTIFIFIPNFAYADTTTRDMVLLELTDKDTEEQASSSYGPNYLAGDVNVRCYGYKWKDNGYGFGFDQEKPEDYIPEEVYTISEYYKGDYSLMDWTHYIKFKTIDYCDFELVDTYDEQKYVARKYHDWPVYEDGCEWVSTNENYETFHIDRVCKMELEVEKVDKFDWESDEVVDNNDDCSPTSCVVDEDSSKIDTDTTKPLFEPTKPRGFWEVLKCWIVELFGGECVKEIR